MANDVIRLLTGALLLPLLAAAQPGGDCLSSSQTFWDHCSGFGYELYCSEDCRGLMEVAFEACEGSQDNTSEVFQSIHPVAAVCFDPCLYSNATTPRECWGPAADFSFEDMCTYTCTAKMLFMASSCEEGQIRAASGNELVMDSAHLSTECASLSLGRALSHEFSHLRDGNISCLGLFELFNETCAGEDGFFSEMCFSDVCMGSLYGMSLFCTNETYYEDGEEVPLQAKANLTIEQCTSPCHTTFMAAAMCFEEHEEDFWAACECMGDQPETLMQVCQNETFFDDDNGENQSIHGWASEITGHCSECGHTWYLYATMCTHEGYGSMCEDHCKDYLYHLYGVCNAGEGYWSEEDDMYVEYLATAGGILGVCDNPCTYTLMTIPPECYEDWPTTICANEAHCSVKFVYMQENCHGEYYDMGNGMEDMAEWSTSMLQSADCGGCQMAWDSLSTGVCGDFPASSGGCDEGTDCANTIGWLKEACGEHEYVWDEGSQDYVAPREYLAAWFPPEACTLPTCPVGRTVIISKEKAIRLQAERCSP